jgi:ArsR family transcriptional regulator
MQIPARDLDEALKDALLLDVRESEEIASQGTLPGALHIPFGQLEARLHELPTDRLLITA